MNKSSGDLGPAFDAMIEKAMTLCGADFGLMLTYDGRLLTARSMRNVPEAFQAYWKQPVPVEPGSDISRVFRDRKTVYVPNLVDSEGYREKVAVFVAGVEQGGVRSCVWVPLLDGRGPAGVLIIFWQDVRSISSRQIALLESLASQAVIAMENARLLGELRQSTDDLTESLAYQTATSELLEVISRSASDVQPVLDTMLAAAARLCDTTSGSVAIRQDEVFRHVVTMGVDAQYGELLRRHVYRIDRSTTIGRVALSRGVVQIEDARADPDYSSVTTDAGNMRTLLGVPLLRDGEVIGVIMLVRDRVETFNERQVALVKTFADQAVIAMENARLLTELREALGRQTATAEVLRVIANTPTDTQPVFDTIGERAPKLCNAEMGMVAMVDGDLIRLASIYGVTKEGVEAAKQAMPMRLDHETATARAVRTGSICHIPDIAEDAHYLNRHTAQAMRYRACLAVPMFHNGKVVGAIFVARRLPGLFPASQIKLLETFADQAVIAIENVRLFTELKDMLDRQTATSEILEVINSSPGDLAPVFEAMLGKAMRLCEATVGDLRTYDGKDFRQVAARGMPEAYVDYYRDRSVSYGPGTGPARILAGEPVVHIPDLTDTEAYRRRDPDRVALVELGGARASLIVPLNRDEKIAGFIMILRQKAGAFSDNQIGLLQNFAAQAVIAMDNARLVNEQREALEQQTATAEILRIINASPGALEPVFDVILAKAQDLCGATSGSLQLFDGGQVRAVATRGMDDAFAAFVRRGYRPSGATAVSLVQSTQFADAVELARQNPDDAVLRATTELGRVRSLLSVPLVKDGTSLGRIIAYRQEVRPFTDKQIALLESFGAQAVIAMENARLLSELRRREEELRVTFDHMGNGVVMFDAELRLASWNKHFQGLLDIPDSFLARRPDLDDYVRLLVGRGELGGGDADQQVANYRERAGQTWSAERTRPDGRVIEVRNNPVPGGGAVLIYADITERKKAEAEIRAARDAAEAALERQTATAEILKVIASSPSDTQPAFNAIAQSANRLLGGLSTAVWRLEDDRYHLMAFTPTTPEADAALKAMSPITRADGDEHRWLMSGDIVEVPDTEMFLSPRLRDIARLRGFRSLLSVPLMVRETAIGFVSVSRREPGGFNADDVQLLKTFADQAVIAIQNARLFNDLRDSLERLKAAQANLVQSEKMASLGQLTAGIAHEIKNPLNFVNNFAGLSIELLDELKEVAGPALATLDEDKRTELEETMSLLIGNLGKIAEHGRRADGIVKSMLSHSRGGGGDWRPSDINALVEEALNLAYHGARAQDGEFNVALERDFEKTGGPIDVVPQDVTRVFLNLFGNGFYAVNKRRAAAEEAGFRPTIKVTTRDLGEVVEVRVRDNGTGIAPGARDKLFQPFFTTKPTGEGTGLGLSISYDIVTQQHGGTIDVESEPGSFTEFTVRLPRSRRVTTAERA
ncbi:MAG: GAF domain-containing protein [Geminicoccaceae bacterium]